MVKKWFCFLSFKDFSCSYFLFFHVAAEGSSRKLARRLSKPLIGNDGRVYVCSEKDLFSFESNGSIAWTARLNHTCNVEFAPVYGGREYVHPFFMVSWPQSQHIHSFISFILVSLADICGGREQSTKGQDTKRFDF